MIMILFFFYMILINYIKLTKFILYNTPQILYKNCKFIYKSVNFAYFY